MAIDQPEFSAIQRRQFWYSRERFEQLLYEEFSTTQSFDVIHAARNLLASLSGMAVQAAFDPDDRPSTRQREFLQEAIEAAVTAGKSCNRH